MNNYSKTEKSCGKEKWSAIGCGISSYFEILMWLAVILYTIYLIWPDVTCLITEPYSDDADWTIVIVFGVLGIIPAYFIIRSILVDIKGKLQYNDTSLHYEGYNFNFFPRKYIVDLQFTDIVSARTYTERIGKSQREILSIKKDDGTKLDLNTCYFNKDEVVRMMYQRLLAQYTANPIAGSRKYRINVHNYKAFITGYLNLEIFVNDKCIRCKEMGIALDVRTGDLFALKHGSNIHIHRLQDTSLTEYYLDDFGNDFNLIIKKGETQDNA